jgi:hypothetical protein
LGQRNYAAGRVEFFEVIQRIYANVEFYDKTQRGFARVLSFMTLLNVTFLVLGATIYISAINMTKK